ncbi:MAG TPA: pyridoxal-dependent decarboxylase [Pyrinomonadaceae bacterium]|nr:pyridoxal-dependent decarboxylase [Pyrinomonadaceae bacterium]
MNRSFLPASAFIDPRGGNRREVESLLSQAASLLLPYLTEAAERSPLPESSFVEEPIPAEPVAEEVLLEKLRPLVAGAMNAAHPGYVGHMNSLPTTMSVVGDFVAAALSNNMLFHELSPTFTPLELSLTGQFARLFGLGGRSGGVMLGSGTMANLQALAVARNVRFGTGERGLGSLPVSPVVLASEAAHSSVRKAAMILGLGAEGVVPVAADENSRMRPESLREEIRKAKGNNREPFCVVATAGTTVTGNIDPLAEVGAVAREHGLWYHVDAAYGGALVFSEEHGRRLAGVEAADSVTVNPHKWLYVSSGCAMALFREMRGMEEAFRVPSPYAGGGDAVTNLGEITVHGSRRVEALKLWLSLQHIGTRGYGRLVDEGCRLTDYFRGKVEGRPYLESVGEPDTNILCFRARPARTRPAGPDEWNLNLQAFLLRERDLFLSCPPYRGARRLRAVLLNPYADERLVDRLFDDIDSFAAGVN